VKEILNYKKIVKIEPIDIGLSKDKKYFIESIDRERFLLRIADISKYKRHENEYERMKHMDRHNIPMSRPVDFGICNDGKNVYQLLTWCEGENLGTLFKLQEDEQYKIGLLAGKILRKIHSVPIVETDITTENWNERFSSFIDKSIDDFGKSGVTIESANLLLDYFSDNRYLLKTRHQCYIHGDYNIGNLIISSGGDLSVIDWEIQLFNSYGDSWKELLMQATPKYSTGMIHGYFNGEPSEDFWHILAVYTSIDALSAVTWAYYRFPEYLDSKIEKCAEVIQWYDNMKNIIPKWYLENNK